MVSRDNQKSANSRQQQSNKVLLMQSALNDLVHKPTHVLSPLFYLSLKRDNKLSKTSLRLASK